MSVRTIIGLAGRAGAGKDTAANLLAPIILRDALGVVITGFASRLKAGLSAMLGFPFDSLTREEKEAKLEWCGKSPRELMQTLGTEWGRGIHPNFWVMLMERRIFDSPRAGGEDVWILTDCRFPNEVDWIRAKGGTVWWIERTGLAPVAHHYSEMAIGPAHCDRTIANLGSITELAADLERAWAQLEASLAMDSGALVAGGIPEWPDQEAERREVRP